MISLGRQMRGKDSRRGRMPGTDDCNVRGNLREAFGPTDSHTFIG
jgi:hypothetical protein